MLCMIKRHVQTVGLVVIAGIAVYSAIAELRRHIQKKKLKKKATKKKLLEDSIIKEELFNLEKDDEKARNAILAMNACQLILAAQSGDLEPIQILRAFTYKACLVTKKFNSVNCIVQSARTSAEKLGRVKNPTELKLYGLPVSVKECCDIQGMDSTIGLVNLIGKPASEDCVLVKVLKHCGAIPFAKTNLSQIMFFSEGKNPIFGETSNPHNVDFTPGGSSAGEASLIASGGSVLGFGTDTGGSIRTPSHMSGICGLKPTLNRISKRGLEDILPGATCVTTSVGPMARDVGTLVLAMRAILCPLMFDLDHSVPRMLFDEQMYQCTKPLRIGYYLDDGYNEPVPAVKRAVLLAKTALEKGSHILVPFKVPKIEKAMELLFTSYQADAGEFNFGRLKNDLVDERLEELYSLWQYSDLRIWLLSRFKSPRQRQSVLLARRGECSTTRLWKLNRDIEAYAAEYIGEWKSLNLDVMICPVNPIAACHKGGVNSSAVGNYNGMFNMLNFPAGSVPVTKVNRDDIAQLVNYTGHYGDEWDMQNKKASIGSLNMPVGVQCVAPTWKDELCLKLMHELETLLKSKELNQ